MVVAVVVMVTRGSIAPGVQAGSGSPPWPTQPDVLVRAAGVQAAETIVGSGTAAVCTGAAVGAGAGAAVGAGAGAAGGAAGAQALSPSTAATIVQRTTAAGPTKGGRYRTERPGIQVKTIAVNRETGCVLRLSFG